MATSMLSRMQKVELLKQIAGSPNIPSPPTVILRVLEKASAPDCSIADLCKIIQMDAGLSGKILRIVNSALFGLSRPATSIQRALAVVGVNSARLLVLAIAMPEMNQKSNLPAQVIQRYWRSSISGAIIAHELAQRFGSRDAEDDMAAGLLRDVGELILQHIFPSCAQEMAQQPEEALVRSQCEVEEVHYGIHHAEVSAFILDGWRLPADITEPIRWHHCPDQGKYSTPKAEVRAYSLHFASCATQLVLHPNHPAVLRDLYHLARERFRMEADEVLEFLRPLDQKVADFAALLQVDMGEARDFIGALTRAAEELIHLSLTASLDNQRALELSHRAESEAQRWRQEAIFDPLTKVFNRRFLGHKLQEYFEPAKRQLLQFGMLFIDLDGFKPLNDRFGHAFGDLALQEVAAALQRVARQNDIVARNGGDEFCVVCEPIDELGLHSVAQRVLEAINKLTIRQGVNEGRLGASIGVVCDSSTTPWKTPEAFMAGADRAMYLAKSRGRNQVVFLKTMGDTMIDSSTLNKNVVSSSAAPNSGFSL